ncbi:hypothetical protein LY90DRAFT_705336 [Neocallimastix californiae]|uniref:Uncharacterized protein n=1 Tax=Neocallimastix californiae TaxID=1754190 RepID=A0A1Y2B9Z9_9FUNG|nr:hypothetical protein LY90DRAFT_705336 [Neocallimastix californiae]|eukprot:ORY31340.1 hypothetical protein LY90DRAFT_705336 [Neocallimastix californiae]
MINSNDMDFFMKIDNYNDLNNSYIIPNNDDIIEYKINSNPNLLKNYEDEGELFENKTITRTNNGYKPLMVNNFSMDGSNYSFSSVNYNMSQDESSIYSNNNPFMKNLENNKYQKHNQNILPEDIYHSNENTQNKHRSSKRENMYSFHNNSNDNNNHSNRNYSPLEF